MTPLEAVWFVFVMMVIGFLAVVHGETVIIRTQRELLATLNALAEMLGEEIDRRKHGKTN